MEVNIIQVGNSKGITIPKKVLEEYNIGDSIELKLKKDHIEIRPVDKPRRNWKSKFEELASDPNEEQMILDIFEDEEL
jgi:antitoxin MazE